MEAGNVVGAIRIADEALATSPDDTGLLMIRGVARIQAREVQAGVDDLRAAAQLKPDDEQLLYNLGNGLALLNKHDAAVRAYAAALKLDPGYAAARQALQKLDPAALRKVDEDAAAKAAAQAAAPRSASMPAESGPVQLGLDGQPLPAGLANARRARAVLWAAWRVSHRQAWPSLTSASALVILMV